MTRFVVHEAPVDGPSTHALIVGVGKYPNLIGGDTPCNNPDGMRQLSSPPISARALATRFVGDYHDDDKPLASLALLVSEKDPQPFTNPQTEEAHELEDPNADNVEAAIKEFKARADADAGARLLFYFCGHGISQGEDYALLTSDFCSDEDNPLQGAIDFRKLTGGFKKCAASEQVFLVDACRSNSDVLIGESEGFAGRVPLLPGSRPTELSKRLSATYFATLAGDKAYSRQDEVSLFTEALLRSLKGAASDNPEEDEWRVNTVRLQEAISHFMKEPIFAGEVAGVQVPVANELAEFPLHQLTSEPEVPVYVGCDPDIDSNELAEFVCLVGADEKGRRKLVDVDPANPKSEWALSLSHGDYLFRAEFAGGQARESNVINVRPIHKRIGLKVP
jgi:hypothetical protein